MYLRHSFRQREEFLKDLNINNCNLAIEIGVLRGDFTLKINEILKPQKIYAVDPYYFIPNYRDANNISQTKININKEIATTQLKTYDNIEQIFDTSHNFLTKQPDETFDFIYVDGDHRYESCLNDLQLSWQKLKSGGILAIDDVDADLRTEKIRNWHGVGQAAIEFYKNHEEHFMLHYKNNVAFKKP